MLVDSNEVRLLTEIGFLAAARGDVRRAQRIFGALECIRPGSAAVYVGLALSHLNNASTDEALRILDRALLLVPAADLPLLHALRALACQLGGRGSERMRALHQSGSHPLALAMLGESATVLEVK